jgi:uncharacterized protein YbjT (DUF2867 family)
MFVIAPASSKTGRAVAELLLSQRQKVRAVVRAAAKVDGLEARGAEATIASLDDAHALGRALQGAAGLYTLLPEDPSIPDFHGYRRQMIDAVIAAVRASQVPHVVFLSAVAASLSGGNGPAKDLHYAEQALRSAAPKVSILRASYFQENVFGAVQAAKHDGIYPHFFGSAEFSFPTIATRDVARIAARLLVDPPLKSEIIDLVGPSYSARDMADQLGRALGKALRLVDIPPEAHVATLVAAGLPRPFAEALAEMFACVASGLVSPRGDRMERGATTLQDVLREGLAAGSMQ